MPGPNEDLVRRWAWAFVNDTDAFLELTHPEIEWAPWEENNTVFHGLEGAMQIRDEWLASFDAPQVEIEEVLEHGDEVVSTVHITGRGKGSGAAVDVRLYTHSRLRDGKAVYMFEYVDRAEALKAAGIDG